MENRTPTAVARSTGYSAFSVAAAEAGAMAARGACKQRKSGVWGSARRGAARRVGGASRCRMPARRARRKAWRLRAGANHAEERRNGRRSARAVLIDPYRRNSARAGGAHQDEDAPPPLMAGRDPFADLVPPAPVAGSDAAAPSLPPAPPALPPHAASAQLAAGIAAVHLSGSGAGSDAGIGAAQAAAAPAAVSAPPEWTCFPIPPGGAALFAEADADGDGLVGRADAKVFFLRTGVPGATLAQVRPALATLRSARTGTAQRPRAARAHAAPHGCHAAALPLRTRQPLRRCAHNPEP